MNKGFYIKLAWTGIEKNKKLYYPYFLAGIVMVMVFYIFNFLATSDVVYSLPGKAVLPVLFRLGEGAVGFFSILFLFYTNSSLIKKRKKELGLYNILGMNKRNIFSVLFRETVISYGIVVTAGILAGFVFSKIAELVLVNIMGRQVNYHIYVEWKAVLTVLMVFAFIYLLILLNALWQIHTNNPIELLHSDSEGERPPKSHMFLTVLSLVLIFAAYGISASVFAVEYQLQQIFVTMVLLIIGTFLLFICASVVMCKIMQKNKHYYYKTSHFITISTMSYRMKRNGASLAAICILVTLVLVACSFSVSFYVGSMETMRGIYPYDLSVRVQIPVERIGEELSEKTYTDGYQSGIDAITQANDGGQVYIVHFANMLAMLVDGQLDLGRDMRDTWFIPGSGYYLGWEEGGEKIVWLHVMSLEEYNRLCGTSEILENNEVFVVSEAFEYQANEIVLQNGEKMAVRKTAKEVPKMTDVSVSVGADVQGDDRITGHGCENVFLVVSDLYAFLGGEEGTSVYAQTNYMAFDWEYYLNLSASEEVLYAIYDQVEAHVKAKAESIGTTQTWCYLKLERGENYYSLAGALLFIAVIMDIVFIAVTALIMYYKQISEGYEDQKRFEILSKVGMTKKEIKSSINFQMLTVFALPLFVAGVHLVFTSNIIYMMQKMVVSDNKPLMIQVMIITYCLFAVVYSLVYALTSRMYFNIVNQSVIE
ncbi:MAG: ABC transporter permease [Lachnospiraceae bacterium]|nr:ABC transporter permease [Lachnospiraceae bacterium]